MPTAPEIVHHRYQLQQQLGQNVGRETWLARDLQASDELVVVKLLTFGDHVSWEILKLFEREAAVLQQLNHPRLPTYRDYFAIEDRTTWFGLVQSYIPGSSLRECLTQGQKFSAAQVQQMAIEILEILIYLHELNPPILHRDIKPSNLVLGTNGHIFLVDFGAVQDRARAEGKSFTVVGTYGYAPIEQYGGRAVAASDLYALGATLLHILTGIGPADLPHDDDGRIIFQDVTSINPHFARWLQRLIEPQVKQRYATARLALAALQAPPPVRHTMAAVPARSPVPIGDDRYHRLSAPPSNSHIQVDSSPTRLSIRIPSNIWSVVLGWGCLATTIYLLRSTVLNLQMLELNVYSHYVGVLASMVVLTIGIAIYLTLKGLTRTQLEIDNAVCCLSSYLFGQCYRQIRFPTQALLYIAPKWRIVQKRNSGFLDWLIWLDSDKNDDNSAKVNVTLVTTGQNYLLSPHDLRPTEANWLIDAIEDWLHKSRTVR